MTIINNQIQVQAIPDLYITKGSKGFFHSVKTIIFDVDRTLANITDSYENCIRAATATYLRLLGIDIPLARERDMVSDCDLYPLWQRQELADVWYLTYAVTAYYLAQLIRNNSSSLLTLKDKLSPVPGGKLSERISLNFKEELATLRTANDFIQDKRMNFDFSSFVPVLVAMEGTDKIEVITNAVQNYFIKNNVDIRLGLAVFSKLWLPTVLKTLFQQMFMDELAYKKEYGIQGDTPQIVCRAYWNNDQTTLSEDRLRTILRKLINTGYSLGIATARPKPELMKFLDTFNLASYFVQSAIISLEGGDKSERLEKSLQAIQRKAGEKTIQPSIYIADTVGDVLAIRCLQINYPIKTVSVGVYIDDPYLRQQNYQLLIRAGTDVYIDSLAQLPVLLELN